MPVITEPATATAFDILKLQADGDITYAALGGWQYAPAGHFSSATSDTLQSQITSFTSAAVSTLTQTSDNKLVQGGKYVAPNLIPKGYLDTSQLSNLLKNTGLITYTTVLSEFELTPSPLSYSAGKWTSTDTGKLYTVDSDVSAADDVIKYFIESNDIIQLTEGTHTVLRSLFSIDTTDPGKINLRDSINGKYTITDTSFAACFTEPGFLYSYNIFDIAKSKMITHLASGVYSYSSKVPSVVTDLDPSANFLNYIVQGLKQLMIVDIDVATGDMEKTSSFVEKLEYAIVCDQTGKVKLTTVSTSNPYKDNASLTISDSTLVKKFQADNLKQHTENGSVFWHYNKIASGAGSDPKYHDNAGMDPFAIGIQEIVDGLIAAGRLVFSALELQLNHLVHVKMYLSDSITVSDDVMDMNSSSIKNLTDPVDGNDAATKKYVDDLIADSSSLTRVEALESQMKQLFGRLFKMDPSSVYAQKL